MKRTEFEHAIRAAGSILGTNQLIVIGSQALHATVADDLPEAAQRSVEVDIVAFDDADEHTADLIDGSIGEASMFHATYGYYAQGVSESTAVLPDGWRDRLVRFETPATNGVAAWCLEAHDTLDLKGSGQSRQGPRVLPGAAPCRSRRQRRPESKARCGPEPGSRAADIDKTTDRELVALITPIWNQIRGWLQELNGLRQELDFHGGASAGRTALAPPE